MYNFLGFNNVVLKSVARLQHTRTRDLVLEHYCSQLRNFETYLQNQALNIWSETFAIPRNLLEFWLTGKRGNADYLGANELLREYLRQFSIMQNEISGTYTITADGKDYTIEELQLLVQEKKLPKENLSKFLNPANKNITVVRTFNPIADLYRTFANAYDGTPYIDRLAACITAYDYNHKADGDKYQKRLSYYFKKWLVMSAAQSMGLAYNNVMLLWLDPIGGTGKSYINEWLYSLPELKQYYIRIGENEAFMDMKGISKSKLAIDWDELPLSQKRYQMFKSHIAAKEGQHYDKKTQSYIGYTKITSYLGSSNKANRNGQPGYLNDQDPAMMRRICPLEIQGQIDYKTYLQLDLHQIWGEAAKIALDAKAAGNTAALSWEGDYAELREMNKPYINIATRERQSEVLKHVEPCAPGEGTKLTAAEICELVKGQNNATILTPPEVSLILRRAKKYRNTKKYVGSVEVRAWWVKIKNNN